MELAAKIRKAATKLPWDSKEARELRSEAEKLEAIARRSSNNK